MRWIKKGLIYTPDGSQSWRKTSALTPTPFLLNPDTIRVYAGFRDAEGVSRIGYVDVDAANPSRIIAVSAEPALDIGAPGMFDDNGVILGDIVEDGQSIRMYYVGFQLVQKAKFLAYSGLAVSNDGGTSFNRFHSTPVLDRADEGTFIRAIHSVRKEEGVWKVWYAAGSRWEIIDGKPFPDYHIRYTKSADGVHFENEGIVCVNHENSEYRIGRPRVYPWNDGYRMFYTRGTIEGAYIAGVADSRDGKEWVRCDSQLGIGLSDSGWDSKVLAYPALLTAKGKTYMFYNGNSMGADGFGYAELCQ